MKWPDNDEPPACARLHTWLNRQDARSVDLANTETQSTSALVEAVQGLLRAKRPLIWLESVDVALARAAVELAHAAGATLHVAQSPGAANTASAASADGWLGSTLAEVHSTATLVIHVGASHYHEAPMLALRFTNPTAQHLFLDRAPPALLEDAEIADQTVQLQWSKQQWLDGLSRVLLLLRDDSAALARTANALDADAGLLAEMLLSERYSVWLWHEDELSDELDRLIVERILEITRQVSQFTRSSALSLALDPGRVTAKDCVLWLTNHTSPMRVSADGWIKVPELYRSLQEWQQGFDWIVCLRTYPAIVRCQSCRLI